MASKLHEDKRYIIVGKPTMRLNKITFSHPDVVETEAPEEDSVNNEGEPVTCNLQPATDVYNS